MLEVFNNLFKRLHSENVIFCNWKDFHAVDKYLKGDGDLDIFIPLRYRAKFDQIAKKEGYRRVVSYQSHFDYIDHYYGLDRSTSQFVHIHLYFKIITGEHVSKNYDLPIENFILDNLDRSTLLPKINNSAQQAIFYIRYFLKIGSIYGIYQFWRDSKKYSEEWNSLNHHFEFKDILELGISIDELKLMKEIYIKSSLLKKFLYSFEFKKKLKKFQRMSYLHHQIYITKNLFIRILNKFFLKKQKILKPGIVVAICGLDGSGKSSIVSALNFNFSKHFCTKIFHLGRPSSTSFTFIFNFFVKIYSFFNRLKVSKNLNNLTNSSKKFSFLFLVRAVLLAYDRKKQSNIAHKYCNNGYIVICDRYPGVEVGKMDSPRIPLNNSAGMIYQFCYKIEQKLYRSIKKAKFIYQLSVPLEVAIYRNNKREKFGKETENELRERFSLNSNIRFLGESHNIIDASISFEKF